MRGWAKYPGKAEAPGRSKINHNFGRKTMKEGGNITIVILGDEGVGKSSLVSTFVSRHFSGQVPRILTRVRLPPDPTLSKCTTTIIDTQEGDATLSNALSLSGISRESLASIQLSNVDISNSKDSVSEESIGGNRRASSLTSSSSTKQESVAARLASTGPFRGVDAIILVYDLSREETFHRIENHWLPLIDQCYHGEMPVIVAGNKMDLTAASHDENIPSRQQIISLLQRFKFVRQATKCSAKKLLNVDEVFIKSQHSVLYPITPLFDLNRGRLTAACSRALARIFRLFDADKDGLLSDAELNVFQQTIWGISLSEKDFSGWKKMATQHGGREVDEEKEGDVVRDGKFTLAGFLAIFDVLITSQNRLEVPWKVLRSLGYDDKLNLTIPASIFPRDGNGLEYSDLHPDDWRLSSSELDFLRSIFFQFDSDGDGTLSSADIDSIFSVLPTPRPPWSERGASLYKDCFSMPRVEYEETPPPSPRSTPAVGSASSSHPSSPSSMISASGVTISSSPLPSIDISKDSATLRFAALPKHKPLSFLSWINHWHMIYTISPLTARAEMYSLGHDFKRGPSSIQQSSSHVPPGVNTPSTFVRALVLGSKDSGKRTLVQKLHRLPYRNETDCETDYPATSCLVSTIVRPTDTSTTASKRVETMVHVIVTEVPALDMSNPVEKMNLKDNLAVLLGRDTCGKRPYDMAVLVFDADASSTQSLEFVKDLESRVLTEEMPRVLVGTTTKASSSGSDVSGSATIREAYKHCKYMDLEPPLIASLRMDTKLDSSVIEHLVSCTEDERHVVVPFRSTPHGEKRRDAAKRKKVLWIGGLVTAGLTVVLGLTLTGKKKVADGGSWLGFFRNLLPF